MADNAAFLAGMPLQLGCRNAQFEVPVAEGRKAGGETRIACDRRLKERRLCRKVAQLRALPPDGRARRPEPPPRADPPPQPASD